MEKTVYILGAGFSYDGGYPLQSDLLNNALNYQFDILSGKDSNEFLNLSNIIPPIQEKLRKFINAFYPAKTQPTLEDVFTLLDQTIARRGHCLSYSWNRLDELRDGLKRTILILFHDASERLKNSEEDFYRILACYLINKRIQAGIKGDAFSIISLNWDCLMEDSIYWCLNKVNGYKKADVDFCCYTSVLGKRSPHTPSVLQKAKRIHNIKISKIHGSANWLLCPNCNRLYTGIGSEEDIWSLYVKQRACDNCSKLSLGIKQDSLPQLEPFFITPTYVKVFDNTHIQMIWHNAYVELAEADKVVFIGYSLPEADYHLRTLIKRAVRYNIPVDVVLTKTDRPPRNTPIGLKKFYSAVRYRRFMGNRVKFYTRGVKDYFNEIERISTLRTNLRKLRNNLRRR